MASTGAATGPVNLGFLTVLQEGGGYLGGLLVTNVWGRPLEFRLSSAVQPNKVQQVLYGPTLVPYVCGELIGKALLDKVGLPVHLVLTDREAALDLRLKVEVPVLWLAGEEETASALAQSAGRLPAPGGRGVLVCHPRFPGDTAPAQDLLAALDGTLDLAEPFARIRDAIAEARRTGVTGRAA
jgi:hypothetical protein